MSTVIMHNVVSVDGFIADTKDQVGPLFDWYVNGDVEILDGGQIKVSRASADYVKTMWAGIGSMVIGRHLFDTTNGWEGVPPAGDHVVVVSHRPRPDDWQPEGFHPVHPREHKASYYFIGDVAQAIAKAKELAGERTVAVGGGRRRRAGTRPRPGRRGGDGRRARGLRLRQAVLRGSRCPASARGPAHSDPGQPGAAPALPSPPLAGGARKALDAVAASRTIGSEEGGLRAAKADHSHRHVTGAVRHAY